MSANVLFNLLNELRKSDKMRGLPSSIIQEHEYHMTSALLKIAFLRENVKCCHLNGRHYVMSQNL